MKTPQRTPVMIVGVVAILAALFGLYYNGVGISAALGGRFSDLVAQQRLAYFYPAFYVMSGICLACYILLFICGVNLLRARLVWWSWLLTGVVVFEVVYFIAVGALWLFPTVGMSIGAATGVANGGLEPIS